MTSPSVLHPFTANELRRFEEEGVLRLDKAFPSPLADAARDILWRETGCDPDDPTSWVHPVIRLGGYFQAPFQEAANTPLLHGAFDQLVGSGRWQKPQGLGTFPVRFPSSDDPGDTGWHVDMSFGTSNPDFMEWRINIRSSGRALLMLFLFSDVGERDAPTLIRKGSHRIIARLLAAQGNEGLSLRDLAANNFEESANCPEMCAIGPQGTVYLCHPFLVHAAQMHRGTAPRFMAQPPLLFSGGADALSGKGEDTPLGRSIRQAIK